MQLYLYDTCGQFFTLVMLYAFKHLRNIVLEMCDEVITIQPSLILTTHPSTIEQMQYWKQFHHYTRRHCIQHIDLRYVIHHYCARFNQLDSNLRDHCTKIAIWICESFADTEILELWKTKRAAAITAYRHATKFLNIWFLRVAIRNWEHIKLPFP